MKPVPFRSRTTALALGLSALAVAATVPAARASGHHGRRVVLVPAPERVYVRDVGRAVRLALQHEVGGEVFNVCEDRTYSMRMWSQAILDAAGSDAELVRVADDQLPEDLKPTGTMSQHIAASGKKARRMLGWDTSDPMETLRTAVRWHLEHPPADADTNFEADDRALASL